MLWHKIISSCKNSNSALQFTCPKDSIFTGSHISAQMNFLKVTVALTQNPFSIHHATSSDSSQWFRGGQLTCRTLHFIPLGRTPVNHLPIARPDVSSAIFKIYCFITCLSNQFLANKRPFTYKPGFLFKQVLLVTHAQHNYIPLPKWYSVPGIYYFDGK